VAGLRIGDRLIIEGDPQALDRVVAQANLSITGDRNLALADGSGGAAVVPYQSLRISTTGTLATTSFARGTIHGNQVDRTMDTSSWPLRRCAKGDCGSSR